MSFAFYVYTILIMGVGLVTASTALVVWLMMRRRDCLVAASGFLLYIWVTLRLRDKVTLARVAAFVVPVAVLQFALVPRTGFASHVQQYLFWLRVIWGQYSAWHMPTSVIARQRTYMLGAEEYVSIDVVSLFPRSPAAPAMTERQKSRWSSSCPDSPRAFMASVLPWVTGIPATLWHGEGAP